MKLSAAVAKSYAKALFELARERGQSEAVGAELALVASVVAQEPQLLTFLLRPWVAIAAKRSAAAALAAQLGLSPLVRDFLGLVAARNRAAYLAPIAAAYRALDDAANGRVRVKLRTVVPLTDQERESLSTRLSRMLEGRKLILEEAIDPQLLGGFVAEVGSRILDGSLDTQLERMRDQLARA